MKRILPTLLVAVVAACSTASSSSSGEPTDPVLADCAVTVDRFKELVVVDEGVLTDPRSSNEKGGPWSFRGVLDGFVPDGADKSAFLLSWLKDWATTPEVNGFPIDFESRAARINDALVCPWLHQTPANGCDGSCGTCEARTLDLAKAPFRLISIVSRFDLHDRPDPDADSPNGEGRFIFAMTDGPADDPASKTQAMTMILEYRLPESLSLKGWAEAWHHLGTHASFDEAYRADLQSLTDRFTRRGVDAKHVSGSALARLRTNESAFNWIWQLRQFTLDGFGQLRLSAVTNTPGESLNNSTVLRDYMLKNAEDIKQDRHILPKSMTAGSANLLAQLRWSAPGVDEQTRTAFARATCNGCHSGEHPTVDTGFHITPHATGIARLSRFLNDPADPTHDELARREIKLKHVLCEK